MHVIGHKLKCDKLHFAKQYCSNSQGHHPLLHFFVTAENVLHNCAVCVKMPERAVLIKDSLALPLTFIKCHHPHTFNSNVGCKSIKACPGLQ